MRKDSKEKISESRRLSLEIMKETSVHNQTSTNSLFFKNETSGSLVERRFSEEQLIETPEPLTFKKAMIAISYLTWPTVAFYFCLYIQMTINMLFIAKQFTGIQRDNIINAIGVTHLYMNCTVITFLNGLISVIETIGSNAFGVKNYYLLGLYFQRSQLIGYIFAVIITIIHFFTAANVIALLNIEADALPYVNSYVQIVLFLGLIEVQCAINFRYLNIIDKSKITLVVQAISTLLHPAWCYLFIIHLDMGIEGAGISLLLSQGLSGILGCLYIYLKNPLPESIFMFNRDSFRGWWDFIKFAMPCAFLYCAEWWAYELQAVIAMWIGPKDYTAHILVANICQVLTSIIVGFSMAGAILVGEEICKANISNVKKYIKLITIYSTAVMTFLSALMLILRHQLIGLFEEYDAAEDTVVYDKAIWSMYGLFALNIVDILQTVFCAFLRGLGKQLIASIFAFINFYIVQTAASILIGKVAGMGVAGMWIGITIGSAVAAVVYWILLIRLDYNKIYQETTNRLEKDQNDLSDSKRESLKRSHKNLTTDL